VNLDLEKLGALMDLLNARDIAEFEHEDEGGRVRIVRRPEVVAAAPVVYASTAPRGAAGAGTSANDSVQSAHNDTDTVIVTSPFVGTFYRAPGPDTPAFVDVGTSVRSGQPLCIVEAMKLMNEIESEIAGTIVEVLAENGKPVEFGQKLFRIKKA
jgi:acetyl-CoA carboxylase biotin carboxyl carrier protein